MKKTFRIYLLLQLITTFATGQSNSNIRLEASLLPADTQIIRNQAEPGREFWIVTNSKGIVTSQGYYFKEKKDGVWREYDRGNGILTKLEEYQNGRKHGAWMTFSLLGQVSIDETFFNDTLQGQRTLYRSNSRVHSFEFYKDGLLSGTKKSFYEDTKLQEEAQYVNGQRHGLSKWFLNNGNPSLEYTYNKGMLEGPSKEYDQNGKVKQEGNYSNNEKEGEWKIYEVEKLIQKITYKAGNIVKEVNVK